MVQIAVFSYACICGFTLQECRGLLHFQKMWVEVLKSFIQLMNDARASVGAHIASEAVTV